MPDATPMKHIVLLVAFALLAAAPAAAGPSQYRQGAVQPSRTGNYWLSRDLQKLVFWQPRERGTHAAPRS